MDALLGRETRQHSDLDIAVPAKDVPALQNMLHTSGFELIPSNDSWEHNFVLEDWIGNQIDVHSYMFDEAGNNVGGVPYNADHLKGEGTILGKKVRCVPAHWLVQFHTGYQIRDKDWHDVRLLCARFELEIPMEYHPFVSRDLRSDLERR